MHRWIGLIGSWAIFVLGLCAACIALTGEWINISDSLRLRRYVLIDKLLSERLAATAGQLQAIKGKSQSSLTLMRSDVARASLAIDEAQETAQTIMVSTTENRLYVRNNHQTVYRAVCSTGKHETLLEGVRIRVFRTPVGKFRVRSKEQNPIWVPPDWHYVEEARKGGMTIVRLNEGQSIDADTGKAAWQTGGKVWDWVGLSSGSRRVLSVKRGTVVETANGIERELPPGSMIRAGKVLVIPPIGTPQRRFEKVLGPFRINLGDGYALHGTQATDQLGRSVSHGCVRLGDADIAALYRMVNIGDEVIIY